MKTLALRTGGLLVLTLGVSIFSPVADGQVYDPRANFVTIVGGLTLVGRAMKAITLE